MLLHLVINNQIANFSKAHFSWLLQAALTMAGKQVDEQGFEQKQGDLSDKTEVVFGTCLLDAQIMLDGAKELLDSGSLKPMPPEGFALAVDVRGKDDRDFGRGLKPKKQQGDLLLAGLVPNPNAPGKMGGLLSLLVA